MTKLIAIAALLAASVSPAFAVDLDHNGSLMTARLSGHRVVIEYAQPRKGLREAGVKPGRVLFIGTIRSGQIEGEATAYKKACPGANYAVSGTVTGGTIELFGPGPVRHGCQWSLSSSSPHSSLVFTGDAAEIATLDADASRPRTAKEMVEVLRPGVAAERSPEPAVATPEPVVETVSRNAAPPPVEAEDEEMTEDQIEEATFERKLYSDPDFLRSIGADPSKPLVPELAPKPIAAEVPAPEPVKETVAATVPAPAPAPEPQKAKLEIDF